MNITREQVQQYDKVTAVVRPLRTDDLKPEAVQMIGNRYTFRALWRVDEGLPYAGDWYMRLLDETPDLYPILWLPLCDLDELELLDRITEDEALDQMERGELP